MIGFNEIAGKLNLIEISESLNRLFFTRAIMAVSFRVRTHIHEYEYESECTGAEKHEIQYISMAGVHTDTSASTGTSHPETY